ncbi:hypothetical protein EON65_43035 [archaeon]|nr:MAG: hypothetical protein EON65_43035 [archaeon]
MNIDDEDIEFVIQQVWKGRCVVSNRRFGGHILPTLTRWHATEPCSTHNLVLMMQTEAEKLHTQGHGVFPAEVVKKIEDRLKWAREIQCAEDMKNSEINSLPARKRESQGGNINTSMLYVAQGLSIVGGVCLGLLIAKK